MVQVSNCPRVPVQHQKKKHTLTLGVLFAEAIAEDVAEDLSSVSTKFRWSPNLYQNDTTGQGGVRKL